MKTTGWMIFLVVCLVGGGLNYTDIGALDPDMDKMKNVKEDLLTAKVTTLQMEGCSVTIKALKRADEKTENIILKIDMKNPAQQEKQIVFMLKVNQTTSSAFARMMPIPVSILDQKIEVTLPPEGVEQKEIILATQSLDTLETTNVTTYLVFVSQRSQPFNEFLSTPVCAFTSDTIQTGEDNNKVLVRQ
ncbi:MAG: hypothetical protein AAB019_03365 [Planctomycetota bacterium]